MYVEGISPSKISSKLERPPLSANQTLPVIDQLCCHICKKVLVQLLQLDCSAVVCSGCLSECITMSASTECPCCVSHHNLTTCSVHPAPELILRLLHDMMVQCVTCKREMKAGEHDSHSCKQETVEVPIEVATVIRHLACESLSNIIQIPTGGTVSMHGCIQNYIHIIITATDTCSCHKGQIPREFKQSNT